MWEKDVKERYKALAAAIGGIASYNGYEEWLWKLSDELRAFDDDSTYYICPVPTEEWGTDKHALWMSLVSVFGDWGTSINSGWIVENIEAADFIDQATDRFADWRQDD